MRWALILFVLSGCEMYFGGPDDDPDHSGPVRPDPDNSVDAGAAPTPDCGVVPEPTGMCAATVSLVLTQQMSAIVPVTLDTTGVTLCVRLDSSAMTHPTYFEAHTPEENGSVPSFGVAIYDANGTLIEDGYDAQLNNKTYATAGLDYWKLQWSQSVHYVKVHAWSRGPAQATQLQLSFYQVLD